VMCMSVCLCSSVEERISEITRTIFTKFFTYIAYDGSSVLLRWGDEIPRGRAILGVFFPIDNASYSIAFGPIQKRLNRSRCRLKR